jgi:transcription elongation factor GreA
MQDVLLTQEGFTKLEAELERLSTAGRGEISERLRHALESGDDLSENGDYFDVQEDQALLEQRIALLDDRLARARVIQPPSGGDVVEFGGRVRLREVKTNETAEYRIVGSAEANPAEFRLSNESPVGRTVLGRRRGETVEVDAPGGVRTYRIVDVAA